MSEHGNQEREYSRLEYITYLIILPVLFTMILAAIILSYFDYDVIGKTKSIVSSIPGVSKIMPLTEEDKIVLLEQALEERNTLIEEDRAYISELETALDERDTSMLNLENEIEQLQQRVNQLQIEQQEELAADQDRQNKIRETARLYAGMTGKNAARMMENLGLNESVLLLNEMTDQQRVGILTRMDPAQAAHLTMLLKEFEPSQNADIAALQERIQLLADSIDEATTTLSVDEMSSTFTAMPAQQAAAILAEMSETQSELEVALKIMANLQAETRSAILGVMETEVSTRFVNALAE